MKKLITLFITIVFFCTTSAIPALCAESAQTSGSSSSGGAGSGAQRPESVFNNVEASFDPATRTASVSGFIDNGVNKLVTIKITDPNGNLELLKVISTLDDGSFSYTYKMKNSTEGSYSVIIAASGVAENVSESFVCEALKISINKTSASILTKETLQLSASITPDYASNKNIIWQSSNSSVASVSSTGLITGVGTGTATITASSEADPLVKTDCTVVVSKKSSGTGGIGGGIVTTPASPPITTITASKPTLDTKTGEAKVSVSLKAITDAFTNSKIGENGVKIISISVPTVEGATSYTPVLPASVLTNGDPAKKIELKTDIASIIVPGNMISNITGDAKEFGINIGIADASNLSDNVKAQIGNRTVIELKVTVDGQNMEYNNPEAPVEVAIPYTPSAEELENPEHIVVWYIDGKGNAISVPTGRYDAATGTVVFKTTHFSQYAIAYVFKTFNDISSYSWAKKPIEVMAAKGIINGISDTNFAPDENITRADFTLLLVKSLGLTAKTDSNFNDVYATDYYFEAVGIAKKLGLAKGQGDNLFNPLEEISRQDMMVITARAMKIAGKLSVEGTASELDSFTDKENIAAYAADEVAAMVKDGLIKGYAGIINPLGNTSRAEAAVLMYRVYNK